MANTLFFLLLSSLIASARAQSAPKAFTVEAYTRLVLDASPEVRQARESFEQAQAQSSSQRAAAILPTLSFTGLATPYGHNPANSYVRNRTDADLSSVVNWNLFNSFQDVQKVRSASYARDAARLALQAARQNRAFEAVKDFYELNSKTQLLDVARQNLKAQEEQYRQTQDLYRNGMKSLSDMLKGETDWRSSELRLVAASADYKEALMRFNTLIGREAWGLAVLRADLEPGTTVLPSLTADLPRALKARPEVQKARSELERAEVSLEQSGQGLFPNLAVNATWTRRNTAAFHHVASASSIPNPNYQLGLSLSLPIGFNLVSQAYHYRGARAEKRRAQGALEAVLRQVNEEAHAAYINLERAVLSYRIAAQKEDIAKRNLDLVVSQYRQGSADAIRLAQAQNDHLSARVERTQALSDIFTNRASYRLAVGEPLW